MSRSLFSFSFVKGSTIFHLEGSTFVLEQTVEGVVTFLTVLTDLKVGGLSKAQATVRASFQHRDFGLFLLYQLLDLADALLNLVLKVLVVLPVLLVGRFEKLIFVFKLFKLSCQLIKLLLLSAAAAL